ncbi:MAG: glycosyltransferase family 4 protein [Chloroflexi bacterium]|nr:glycosyltransferase family 4 protein [Chloroflexota bacterium]
MRIGVDASRLTRSRPTGTENYSRHVVEEVLRRPRDPELRYRLYFNEPPSPGLAAAALADEVRSLPLPRLWTHLALGREMALDPPDVLWVPSHVLPIVHPRRSVAVVYDVGHRYFPRAHRLAEWVYVEWAIRRHVREASAILTISHASRRDILRLYGRYGATPQRVVVAYPAVDEAFQPANPVRLAEVRRRYALPARYVLALGTIKPRKNLPRLVRAFARARLGNDVGLAIGGGTSFGSRDVERAIEETRLQDRVHRLSYVEYEDLPALYSGAACVAIPSLHEGFGIPALEALACGAPVLASNRSALPEIVGQAGLQVDPLSLDSIAEGLRRILLDDTLARSLREAGPVRARVFTWAEAGRVTAGVLGAVAGDRPLPADGRDVHG